MFKDGVYYFKLKDLPNYNNNLRDLMKNDKKGNKLNYYWAIVVISHAFNRIFTDSENMKVIFKDYFEQSKRSLNAIDYSELR